MAETTETFGALLSAASPAAVLLDPRGEATLLDDEDAAPDAMVCEEARFLSWPLGFSTSGQLQAMSCTP